MKLYEYLISIDNWVKKHTHVKETNTKPTKTSQTRNNKKPLPKLQTRLSTAKKRTNVVGGVQKRVRR